jgi:hypothetical protein
MPSLRPLSPNGHHTLVLMGADGEPDPHAVALRRVESLEQVLRVPAVEASASISDGHAHVLIVLPLSSDQHLARASVDTSIASEALRSKFKMTCCS